MVITNRDRKLLLKLHTYGMLATNQVKKIVFSDIAVTTVLRRLRILEKKHLIKRIEGLVTSEKLWALTEKGAEIVEVKLYKRHFAKSLLDHDYKLLEVRLTLEGNGIAHSWTPEHEIRSKVYKRFGLKGAKERLIPDGLVGIEHNRIKKSVAVELELNFKSERRYYKIFNRYYDMKETFAVWYIVSTVGQGDQLYRLWWKFNFEKTNVKFYVSLYDDLIKNVGNATLFSKDKGQKVKDVFSILPEILPAQETAQRVSTQDEKIIAIKTELTKENHAPILEMAS